MRLGILILLAALILSTGALAGSSNVEIGRGTAVGRHAVARAHGRYHLTPNSNWTHAAITVTSRASHQHVRVTWTFKDCDYESQPPLSGTYFARTPSFRLLRLHLFSCDLHAAARLAGNGRVRIVLTGITSG